MTSTCGCRRIFGIVTSNVPCTFNYKLRQFSSSLAPNPLVVRPSTPPSSQLSIELEAKRHAELGIVELMGTNPKVSARIKDRADYFQVHEIDFNGNRVQLTDLINPPPPPPDDNDEEEKEKKMKYLHFTMYKEEVNASEAVSVISKRLKKSGLADVKGKITYAGRKDRMAQTTQRMCVPNYSGRAYSILTKFSAQSRQIKLGNYAYASHAMNFGHLKGNHFKVLLKNVQLPENTKPTTTTSVSSSSSAAAAVITLATHSLKEVGFVNYFGLQRFGGVNDNHLLGGAVLRMNWQEVIDLILTPRQNDSDHNLQIKDVWWETRDPEKMMDLVRQRRSVQLQVTQLALGLSRHYDGGKGDLLKVYRTIPWDVRSIHISAFASFLWNKLATFRIRNFGLMVIPGDIVYISPLCPDLRNPLLKKTVKILTEKDLKDDKYSIYDVLLPVLGSKVNRYPIQEVQEYCDELLAQHGLAPDCFSTFPLSTEIEMGFYRHLLVKPQNVDHQIIPYNVFTYLEAFMPSDLDLLDPSMRSSGHVDEKQNYKDSITSQKTSHLANDKTAAVVEFSLPTSSYATMAFREVMQTANFE